MLAFAARTVVSSPSRAMDGTRRAGLQQRSRKPQTGW
uniref:Carnitine acetyltransferase n=1 Tax=Mus musculus TaxID=10090 RepID=D6REV7_MOUSE